MKTIIAAIAITLALASYAEATQRFRQRVVVRPQRQQVVVQQFRQPVLRQQVIVTQPLFAPQLQLRQFAVPQRQQIIIY